MAKKSLNRSIFRLVVGLIALTSITLFLNVWVATIDQTKTRLDNGLQIGQNVLERVLKSKEELLFNSAHVLTADFGFKKAVASKDKGTIDSALTNHGSRINADLMALVSLEGKTITSAPEVLTPAQGFPYNSIFKRVLNEGGVSVLMMLNGQLYQVIMLTVDAPRPIAIALIGFKLDMKLIQELTEITKLNTTLQVFEGEHQAYNISTLTAPLMEKALSQVEAHPSWLSITVTKDIPYISRQFVLADELGHKTVLTLSEDVQKLFADFVDLQTSLLVTGTLAVLLASFLGALFSNRIAKPLSSLVTKAKEIAVGNYSNALDMPCSTEEVSQLSDAFTSMQNNIQSREEKIIFQARHDTLTSLYNRQYVETFLDEKFKNKTPFVAIGINIFGFRGINDIFGYHNGDTCLKELANRLTQFDGIAARVTGGELLWLPDDIPDQSFIEKMKSELEQKVDAGHFNIDLKVAIGMITCPKDASSSEDVFKSMNIVLDEAQITRQFILPFHPELEARYSRRLSIITELKNTLKHAPEELSLNYQPKLNLVAGKVTHVEALIRWTNKQLGFVSPEDFIAIAEQAGFIHQVTEWVINQAISDAAKFHHAGFPQSVAINLSAKDIMNASLLPHILKLLEHHKLPIHSVSFELTEGDLVKDHATAISHMQAYQDAGFELAIDDFGTGYSSMAYLQNLPVNTLKVDKSFVLKLNEQEGDRKIVQTVISLAHSFDMNVVAEGVENLESLQLLAKWGCELAQGYYICKPAKADDLLVWLAENQDKEWL
ncbi:EAL domain-containing protein [Paraglaciecola sp. 2405UD69-4]|uniref:EAL domain-containing protein n=1 Tax=Paraglaciecola sp. 2405UD69-4 TaxID=3391836 RepID=UPI0039C9F4F9